jgi:ElaB/YqjD/DUF883 family membrane-anchored ribosome-binding protein
LAGQFANEIWEDVVDDRIEALLRDLQDEQGKDNNEIRENVRRHLAEREEQFRNNEVDRRKKDKAAQRCRTLIRKRVVEEEIRSNESMAAHLRFVLSIIDDPARAPPTT